ncbi:MAG: hypothetical protein HC798_04185 [Polaribacter sp.]|nr:hypothetical protein [Polaribacter sp.]
MQVYGYFWGFVFIISDSLLAINKFYDYHQLNGFLIMVTYIIAQFLISKFMISLKVSQ